MSDAEARMQVEEGIAEIEQILDVMPDDLLTLRTLFEIRICLEDSEGALESLGRLDDAARAAQNRAMMDYVYRQYASVVDDVPEARERMERLQGVRDTARQEAGVSSALDSEMKLAWHLLQDEILSEEEYSHVLHDLTEMSSRRLDVPVTVLHVLHDQSFSRIERLMAHLSLKSGVPVIPLGRFEEQEALRGIFPVEFMSRNGAIPFGEVAGDLLLAVLNPFDKALLQRSERVANRRCHPCLVHPQEYDDRLGRIRKALSE